MVRHQPRLHAALAVAAMSIAALGMVAAGVEIGQGRLIGDRQAPDGIVTRPAAQLQPPRARASTSIEIVPTSGAGPTSEPVRDPQPAPAPGTPSADEPAPRPSDDVPAPPPAPTPGPPTPLTPTPEPVPGVVDPLLDPVTGLLEGLLGVPGSASTSDDANGAGVSPAPLLPTVLEGLN